MDLPSVGRALIALGVVVAIVGAYLALGGRLPPFGQLPGDLVFKWDNVTVHLPLGTMVLVSIVLTVLLNVAARFFR